MSARHERGSDLQGRLRWLLIQTEASLPPLTVGFVSEFIEANECGLALETISEMLLESAAEIDRSTLEAVAELTQDMGLDEVNVARLMPLVRPGD
jgi:hypothetical protein